eukprot:357627-Chlamydomonas_euryale.AAC.5
MGCASSSPDASLGHGVNDLTATSKLAPDPTQNPEPLQAHADEAVRVEGVPAARDDVGAVTTCNAERPRSTHREQQSLVAAPSTSPVPNVHDVLVKMSSLIQRFAEARSERATAVQVLRRVLDMVVADCNATYASIQVLSDRQDSAMALLMVCPPQDFFEQNRMQALGVGAGHAADAIVHGSKCIQWNDHDVTPPPTDWELLIAATELKSLTAVPIRVANKCIGILTLGRNSCAGPDRETWPLYMQLIAASMCSMIKDTAIPLYVQLVKDVQENAELNTVMHKMIEHIRRVLGHAKASHIWYRVALAGSNNVAATIFDDLTQVR